jgi:hypothetical protein
MCGGTREKEKESRVREHSYIKEKENMPEFPLLFGQG